MIRTLFRAVTIGRKRGYDRLKIPMKNGNATIVFATVFIREGESQVFPR
jgi:hypothetical protein